MGEHTGQVLAFPHHKERQLLARVVQWRESQRKLGVCPARHEARSVARRFRPGGEHRPGWQRVTGKNLSEETVSLQE